MDKTNINALLSIERFLHSVHKSDFQLNNRNSNKFGLNFSLLYPSINSHLNILAGRFIKRYPLAHLAAVIMSMFAQGFKCCSC